MNSKDLGSDRQRWEHLRATLSDAEIEALAEREKSDPHSLTPDEVGVLFLVTRDRLRKFERKARDKGPSGKE